MLVKELVLVNFSSSFIKKIKTKQKPPVSHKYSLHTTSQAHVNNSQLEQSTFKHVNISDSINGPRTFSLKVPQVPSVLLTLNESKQVRLKSHLYKCSCESVCGLSTMFTRHYRRREILTSSE